LDQLLSAALQFGQRHERVVAMFGAVWFVISCASRVPFQPIPEVPYLTGSKS